VRRGGERWGLWFRAFWVSELIYCNDTFHFFSRDGVITVKPNQSRYISTADKYAHTTRPSPR
jgi:hypothetical protein